MPLRTRRAARVLVGASFTLATLSACGNAHSDKDLLERMGEFADAPDAEGEVVTRIWDMNEGSTKITHHVVWGKHKSKGVEIRLADDEPVPERGSTVKVWGSSPEDGVIEVDEIELVAPPPEPLIDPELYPPRRIGAILVFWGSPGLGNADAEASLFSDADATSVFYGENSYGKERVVGEVFGPYEIPDPGACNPQLIADNAIQAMEDKGHDPTQFGQLMYHFPGLGDCGFGGLANLGAPLFPARDSWYNGSWGCTVRNQELGHNYGMGHSRSYDCQDAMMVDVPFSDDCTFEEYGDPYDPMGGGCGHMNVAQKTYMGWIEGCNIVTATADGTFNVSALELPCNGPQAIRFPTHDGRYFWVEYRSLGLYNVGDGVLVHVASEIGNNGPSPYIIDVNPAQGYFLHAGETYTDFNTGLVIEVLEENERYAVIQATFVGGGAGAPECWNTADVPGTENGNVGTLECAEIPFPADDTPPTIAILEPANDTWFDPGSDFTIIAEANDNRIISQVEIYAGVNGGAGEAIYRLNEPPWEFDVTNIPEGEYQFAAIAYDGRNPGVASETLNIHVGTMPAGTTTGVDDSGTSGPMSTTFPTTDSADAESTGEMEITEDPKGCGCTSGAPRGSVLAFGMIVLAVARRRRAYRR